MTLEEFLKALQENAEFKAKITELEKVSKSYDDALKVIYDETERTCKERRLKYKLLGRNRKINVQIQELKAENQRMREAINTGIEYLKVLSEQEIINSIDIINITNIMNKSIQDGE